VPPGRQPPAPGSCLYQRVGPDFPQPSLFPIDRFHLAGPIRRSRPFTGFLFATPCEAGGISQVWMLPLNRYGRLRAPWPPSSCARLLHPSSSPVAGLTFDQLGSAGISTAFRGFSIPSLSTSRFPSDDRDLTTLLSIAYAGVARLRPGSGRHPSSLRRKSASWPPSTCARLLPAGTRLSLPKRAFHLSSRRLSSGRFPISLARLTTSRCSGPCRPGDHFRHRHLPCAQVCTQPLLISLSRAA